MRFPHGGRERPPHTALLIQLCGPIHDQGHGDGFSLGDDGYEEAASVWGNLERDIRGQVTSRKQLAKVPSFELITFGVDSHGEKICLGTIKLRVIDFPSVPAPSGRGSAILRYLPPAVATWERSDVNLL